MSMILDGTIDLSAVCEGGRRWFFVEHIVSFTADDLLSVLAKRVLAHTGREAIVETANDLSHFKEDVTDSKTDFGFFYAPITRSDRGPLLNFWFASPIPRLPLSLFNFN